MNRIVTNWVLGAAALAAIGAIAEAGTSRFLRSGEDIAQPQAVPITLVPWQRAENAPPQQTVAWTSGSGLLQLTHISSGAIHASIPWTFTSAPRGSAYHQTVDVYFDRDGNKLETVSRTHAVDADCHPGRRAPPDLVAQDDGKGNVRFAQTRLPSEPEPRVVVAEARP